MLDKAIAILRAIAILDALRREKGRYRLGEISHWSRTPRATADRHIRQLVAWKLITQTEGQFNGLPCRLFAITNDGHDLIRVYGA